MVPIENRIMRFGHFTTDNGIQEQRKEKKIWGYFPPFRSKLKFFFVINKVTSIFQQTIPGMIPKILYDISWDKLQYSRWHPWDLVTFHQNAVHIRSKERLFHGRQLQYWIVWCSCIGCGSRYTTKRNDICELTIK